MAGFSRGRKPPAASTIRRMEAPAPAARRAAWHDWVDWGAAALGLQMAVAGLAAFYIAQLLRLEVPSWSVFTVCMLLMAQYVGAIHEKAVFRMVATVAGGSLGYLAIGAWQQSPALYLGATFAVAAFSVAMFSQSRAPYAFFLTGLTFVVIGSNSQAQPSQAWAFALARTEEVFLGVVVSLVVQSTVFPRYANRDFRRLLDAALTGLADAAPRAAGRFAEAHTGLAASLRDFPARANALRTLLRFGARESGEFRRELGLHSAAVGWLARAANLLQSLERSDPAPEPYRSSLGPTVRRAGEHLGRGWRLLRDQRRLGAEWRSEARAIRREIIRGLLALRGDTAVQGMAPGLVGAASAHLLTLGELHETLLRTERLWRLPPPAADRAQRRALAPAWPDGEAIRRGLRAGLATCAAMVIENWLSPPGGPLMVLAVFMFSSLNALSPEGSGDRGAFGYVLGLSLVLAGVFVALVAGSPLLASYAVLNILLGTWLFLLGYWVHDRGGLTVPAEVSFLLLVSVLGLDAQKPVPLESIAGIFFALVNGLVIASVAQRLLWPTLPQRQLQAGLAGYLRTTAACVPQGFADLPLWQRARLSLFPSRAHKLLGAMRGPACTAGQMELLGRYITALQNLTGEISLCAGRLLPLLPEPMKVIAADPTADVKRLLGDGITGLADAFAGASRPPDRSEEIRSVMRRWDACCQQLRAAVYGSGLAPERAVPILGTAARYRAALGLLLEAGGLARQLDPADYLGDVAL